MPKPKPKKRTTRSKRKSPGKGPFIRRDLILPVLAVAAAVIAAVVFFLGAPKDTGHDKPVSRKPAVVKTPPPASVPSPAPVERPDARQAKPYTRTYTTTAPVEGGPRVAIVIDDMGQNPAHLDALIGLGGQVGVSILPYQPYSRQTAVAAREAGLDVLLHMPMEADTKYNGLGEGALYVGMNSDELTNTLDKALDMVPGAMGMNNHMGSALTADRASMKSVMSELKRRRLFFLDSRTTAETVAESTAREMGVPTAARKVFLDDSNEPEDVRKQFERLIKLAKKDGVAIAIGHPRPATLEVLREGVPELEKEGIALVRVSSLVN